MQKTPGSKTWVDPDDAPPLTSEMLADAEVFDGNIPVRRRRGRPSTGTARELISVRLDTDLVAQLRAAGPGWQSQINPLLRAAMQLGQQQHGVVPLVMPHTGRILGAVKLCDGVVSADNIAAVETFCQINKIFSSMNTKAKAETKAEISKPASRPAKARAGKSHPAETLKR